MHYAQEALIARSALHALHSSSLPFEKVFMGAERRAGRAGVSEVKFN